MTSGLKADSYEKRCKEAGLETRQARVNMQDIAQVFKILKGIDRLAPTQCLPPEETGRKYEAVIQPMEPDS